MANKDLFREPDENSGPALLDREPIVLPEQRKNVASELKKLKDDLME